MFTYLLTQFNFFSLEIRLQIIALYTVSILYSVELFFLLEIRLQIIALYTVFVCAITCRCTCADSTITFGGIVRCDSVWVWVGADPRTTFGGVVSCDSVWVCVGAVPRTTFGGGGVRCDCLWVC